MWPWLLYILCQRMMAVWVVDPSFKMCWGFELAPTGPVKENGDGKVSSAFFPFVSGWLTVGPTLTNSNYNAETYASYFSAPNSYLTGCTEEIERLRPKSPPPKSKSDRGGGAPRGGGRGGTSAGRGRERNRSNFRGERGGFRGGRGGTHRGGFPPR